MVEFVGKSRGVLVERQGQYAVSRNCRRSNIFHGVVLLPEENQKQNATCSEHKIKPPTNYPQDTCAVVRRTARVLLGGLVR